MARKPRRPPFSLRMSDAQWADLDTRAGLAGLSKGGYVLSTIFNTPPPRRSRRKSADMELVAQLLPALGKVGGLVNQLAKKAHLGSWADSRLIAQACADIRAMRNMAERALGFIPPEDDPDPPAGPPA